MGIIKTRRILTGLISVVGCYLSHLFTYIVISKSHGFSGDSVLVVAIRESRHCYITPLSLAIPVIGAIVLMILTDKKTIQKAINYKYIFIYQALVFYAMELFKYSVEDYHHAPTLKEIYVGSLIQIPIAVILTFLTKITCKLINKIKTYLNKNEVEKKLSPIVTGEPIFTNLVLAYLSKLLRSPPLQLA